MCGMKDSLRSKTTPRNSVSSTTGTGIPFSNRMGSGWGLRDLQKCMHTVLKEENLNPLVSAQSASLLRHCLEVTLNNMDMLRSVADQKIVDI